MGSGILKTLSSHEVPHNQFLYIFSSCCHSPKPVVGLLLWCLSGRLCNCVWFFIDDTSVVHYCIASLTRVWSPLPLVVRLVPCMLGAVATNVPPLVTSITLNFAKVPLPSFSPSSLEEPSAWQVSSFCHCHGVYFFTSCNTSTCSSCRCIHGIWVW